MSRSKVRVLGYCLMAFALMMGGGRKTFTSEIDENIRFYFIITQIILAGIGLVLVVFSQPKYGGYQGKDYWN